MLIYITPYFTAKCIVILRKYSAYIVIEWQHFLKGGSHFVNQIVLAKLLCRPPRRVLLGVTKKAFKRGSGAPLDPPL